MNSVILTSSKVAIRRLAEMKRSINVMAFVNDVNDALEISSTYAN